MTIDTTQPIQPTPRRRRRLNWWNFRRVEAWLEMYHEMLREIAERESLIVDGALSAALDERTPGRSQGRPADPTGTRGSRLADDWDLQKNRQRCRAIADTLDGLDWAHRTLVRVYYWEAHKRITWAVVGAQIRANEKTCRDYRNAIIDEIGARLGL